MDQVGSIQSVIIGVIPVTKSNEPKGESNLSITSMIMDRIEQQEFLLPISHNHKFLKE